MAIEWLVAPDCVEPLSLADGIARLEQGGPRQGLTVDLGNGNFARANGRLGQAGLLQRLVGHRLIVAFAADVPLKPLNLPPRQADILPEAKELLDLARPLS